MKDQELVDIWKSYGSTMDEVVAVNKQLAMEVTKGRVQKSIGKLRRPKAMILMIGIPYAVFMCGLTAVAFLAGGVFPTIGFGAITIIMLLTIGLYMRQLYLIGQINGADEIQHVQERLSKLKLSSYNSARLAVVQLPFWSICWISMDALIDSPWLYGGINLLVLVVLTYITYWLYAQLSLQKSQSKVRQFILSGNEWDPLIKSSDILDQLKDLKDAETTAT